MAEYTALPENERTKIAVLFGTRPEIIKLAPVIEQLTRQPTAFESTIIHSGQHADLPLLFLDQFGIRVDYDLQVMRPGQTPNGICSRLLQRLEPLLLAAAPDLLVLQGDTTTALAGALAGFHCRTPVGHVEAGLRSGQKDSPFPEEMNRRLISRLATHHFAPTPQNRTALINEGVPAENIYVTGNPVVDAVLSIRRSGEISEHVQKLLAKTSRCRRLVLTCHRRENMPSPMAEYFRVIRGFVQHHQDVALLFPVHLNPVVDRTANKILAEHPRIHLLRPLGYSDFICLLAYAWLVVSDSGGIQEEAPTLGKPLLILRDNTERPEVIECGIARLVGGDPTKLHTMLEEAYREDSWTRGVSQIANPFGTSGAGQRIVNILRDITKRRVVS